MRLDSEKLEKTINIEAVENEKKETHQMKYEYEAFISKSDFQHSFACKSNNPLIISAFWHLLFLFKENNYITAKSSVGHGEIDLSSLEAKIPQNANKLYLEHLVSKKETIVNSFNRFHFIRRIETNGFENLAIS